MLKSDDAQTLTREERDLGAASVVQLFKVEHKIESQSGDPSGPKEDLVNTLNVAVIANGSASNPLSDLIISSENDEGDENPLPVHKVDTKGLNNVESVEGKWVNANNLSAGYYIFVKGSQNDLSPEGDLSPKNKLITIKITDSTNVYLENLEVTVSEVEKAPK